LPSFYKGIFHWGREDTLEAAGATGCAIWWMKGKNRNAAGKKRAFERGRAAEGARRGGINWKKLFAVYQGPALLFLRNPPLAPFGIIFNFFTFNAE
jgi:hypothetical protein